MGEQGEEALEGGRTGTLLAKMRESLPIFGQSLPLASGIEEQLTSHFSAPNWRVIAALRRHVQAPEYLRGLLQNDQRFDLNGEVRSYVSEEERRYARHKLERMGEKAEVALEEETNTDKTEGLRLLITLQSAHKFGHDMAEQVEPFLNRMEGEDALMEAGVKLLEVDSREEWLAVLESKTGALG